MSLNDGSFKSVMDELEQLAATVHPSLHVYRWWRPDMALPAIWHWMTPGEVTAQGAPACRVDDLLRITVSIGVDPTAVAGAGDMLEVEEYADLARDAYNAALYARNPLDQRNARRRGMQTVADTLGDASILILELPLEVELHRPVTVTP